MRLLIIKNRNHSLIDREKKFVKLLMAYCESTGDIQARLKQLFAGTIEHILEAEMDEHLGYEKNSALGNNSGNSRNGYGKKTGKSIFIKITLCLFSKDTDLKFYRKARIEKMDCRLMKKRKCSL